MAITTAAEVEDAEEYIRSALRVVGNIADSESPRAPECRVALDEIVQRLKKLNIEKEIAEDFENYLLTGDGE